MVVFDFFVFVLTAVLGVYAYFKWKYSYWKRKHVPCLIPEIPFGTPDNPFKSKLHPGLAVQVPYKHFKKNEDKHGGLYMLVEPVYLVLHPEYIKNVLTKDFEYFTDRGWYYNKKDDPFSVHLLTLEGKEWYKLRTKFTPTFTSGKIKMMFTILKNCSEQLNIALNKYCINREPTNIKSLLECYSTDVTGSCAFGIECNSFIDPNNDFRKCCLKFLHKTEFYSFRMILAKTFPKLGKFLKICLVNKDIRTFFLNIVRKTISYRDENNVSRNDFLNLLMELRKTKENENGLTITEIAAQAFIFFIAGFESSSSAISFSLYELASSEDVQDKARYEILNILEKHNNEICYEAIMEMPYLGQVVDEVLRKYPPLPVISRMCVKDYNVPNTNILIEKGTKVTIPCYAIHHDSDFFPDPEKFDPERFSIENKPTIPPFSYLPFGLGPRNCIALRFGLLQTKVALVSLLKNFKFSVNKKTKAMEFENNVLFLRSLHDIWLDIEKLNLSTN